MWWFARSFRQTDDYLKGLSEVLSEWVSPEDEEAWRDL